MRLVLMLALSATTLPAQGVFGGRVLDDATSKPLSCIEVALVDSTDSEVARHRARTDGTFEFLVPAKGQYRVSFLMHRHRPALTAPMALDPAVDVERTYRVGMVLDTTDAAHFDLVAEGLWYREPGQPSKSPRDFGARSLNGYAIIRYAIDVDGRVVPGSIEALSSTGPPYARAYTESIATTKFVASRHPEREPLCVMRVDSMRWGTQMMVRPE